MNELITYPLHIRHKIHIHKKLLKSGDFNKIIETQKQIAGPTSFEYDQIEIDLQFVSLKTLKISPIQTILINLENKSWYKDLLHDYDGIEAYVLVKSVKYPIESYTRNNFVGIGMIYLTTNSDVVKGLKVRKHHTATKKEIYYTLMKNILDKVRVDVVATLSRMDSSTFGKFLMGDECLKFMNSKFGEYLSDDKIYGDEFTTDVITMFKRYYHIHEDGDTVEEMFLDYLENLISRPLQCLLYYCKNLINLRINEIHSSKKKKNVSGEMTLKEFEEFWNEVIGIFLECINKELNLNQMLDVMNSIPQNFSHNIYNSIKDIVTVDSTKTFLNHDHDTFNDFYREIKIPYFYQILIEGYQQNSDEMKKRIEKNSRLTLFGKRLDDDENIENVENVISISLIRDNKDPIVYDLKRDSLVFDTIKNEHSEFPLLQITSKKNKLNPLLIDPISGDWFSYNQEKKEFVKEDSKLDEYIKGSKYYLIEK